MNRVGLDLSLFERGKWELRENGRVLSVYLSNDVRFAAINSDFSEREIVVNRSIFIDQLSTLISHGEIINQIDELLLESIGIVLSSLSLNNLVGHAYLNLRNKVRHHSILYVQMLIENRFEDLIGEMHENNLENVNNHISCISLNIIQYEVARVGRFVPVQQIAVGAFDLPASPFLEWLTSISKTVSALKLEETGNLLAVIRRLKRVNLDIQLRSVARTDLVF